MFGVWGLGFRVSGLGFGVQCLGFRVWGLGLGFWVSGFRGLGLMSMVFEFESRGRDPVRVQGVFRVSGFRGGLGGLIWPRQASLPTVILQPVPLLEQPPGCLRILQSKLGPLNSGLGFRV